jgi:hypothetical protein
MHIAEQKGWPICRSAAGPISKYGCGRNSFRFTCNSSRHASLGSPPRTSFCRLTLLMPTMTQNSSQKGRIRGKRQ